MTDAFVAELTGLASRYIWRQTDSRRLEARPKVLSPPQLGGKARVPEGTGRWLHGYRHCRFRRRYSHLACLDSRRVPPSKRYWNPVHDRILIGIYSDPSTSASTKICLYHPPLSECRKFSTSPLSCAVCLPRPEEVLVNITVAKLVWYGSITTWCPLPCLVA